MPKAKKIPKAEPLGAAGAMAAVNPIATTAWLKIMNESAGFVMERLQRDLEMQQAMLRCTSPAELLKLQTEFYQTAMQDYSAEAVRVFERMSAMTKGSLDEATSNRARNFDDVPL